MKALLATLILLVPAVSAIAGFRLRIPAIHRASGASVSSHPSPAAPDAAATAFAFPEGRLEAAYLDELTGAVFTRHSCALQPYEALAAATRALVAAGWRQVLATGSVALFEGAGGRCAAVAATPAPTGGATVAAVIQR